MNSYHFVIGGHHVCLSFSSEEVNSLSLLPSFSAFAVPAEACAEEPLLFHLVIDDTLQPAPQRKLLRKFDTGNGDTLVYTLPDGGYQYIIRDIGGNDCCLLIAREQFTQCKCALTGDWTLRSFGLNNALMLAYAFAGSYHDTLLVHASAIEYEGKAYPFIASSGTGKSTHTSLWLKYIEGAHLLNDDNPILRIVDGEAFLYGSPWSGKTPCYRNRRARLGAVSRIERALENSVEKLKPVSAFASLLPACSSMKWDTTIYDNLCTTVTRIIETTPIYTVHCLPDEGAARLSHKILTQAT
ncbi:MAG: hypothetical protein J5552_05635 [Prevotella sp.]|nr:hypothetical protein [Prevotella sp.]